jgi:hypothetical protein
MYRQRFAFNQHIAVRMLVRSAHQDIGILALLFTCCVTAVPGYRSAGSPR